jgi:calcium-translocating P-type ATPase
MTSDDTMPSQQIGLTDGEAARRIAEVGPNVVPVTQPTPLAVRFARELVHFFAVMLWVAAALAWIAGLPALSVAIAAVVVLNATFAFVQERRADRAADRLRVLLPSWVTVRRGGASRRIDARDVVPGDAVELEAGDRVPGDGHVHAADGLQINASLLTGESGSVAVGAGGRVYTGTFVVEGSALVTVDATGAATRLAGIAALTSSTHVAVTPLTRELTRLVRTIAAIATGVGLGFFVLAWLIGHPADEGLVFAVGVTVALVPEALLPTVTLSLAWGAEQMARRNVLVRNLDAVETLGSTTFICTDKTGTLTCNEMTVVEAWTPLGSAVIDGTGYGPTASVVISDLAAEPALLQLASAALACSTGWATVENGRWTAHGEPMDAALDAFSRRLGLDTPDRAARDRPVRRFAFQPNRRRTSTVTPTHVFVKGAPEAVLPLCSHPAAGATDAAMALTTKGLRVIAVAMRTWTGSEPTTADEADADVELLGLIAFEDPLRPGVAEALDACRRAGVRVAMLTGDHPATAAAIASKVGLMRPDGTVLTSDALPDDDAVLGAMLDRDGIVVARVAPEDKLRIARALRARGHVVAMTGDGVNDAPALHEAAIGIAMGASGTDVAREAADLVLLDDHFASIVAGIEQGRTTYANIRRFLTYHLTDNVAELTPFAVWALSGGRFPLALGVLQILALDLGTDTLSAVALGAEPPAGHTLDGPPVSGRLLDWAVVRRAFLTIGPLIAAAAMFAFVASLVAAGWRPGAEFPTGHALMAASGATFMTTVLAQTANAFTCRSFTRTPRQLGWTTNRLLIPAATIELCFSLLVLFVPRIALELEHASPPLIGWVVAVASIPLVLAVDALDK